MEGKGFSLQHPFYTSQSVPLLCQPRTQVMIGIQKLLQQLLTLINLLLNTNLLPLWKPVPIDRQSRHSK